MLTVRLTDPQIGAIQCRDWSEEPVMRAQLIHDRTALHFLERDRVALAEELNTASNAEDEHAQQLRREGELECARHAARAARVLANVMLKVFRCGMHDR